MSIEGPWPRRVLMNGILLVLLVVLSISTESQAQERALVGDLEPATEENAAKFEWICRRSTYFRGPPIVCEPRPLPLIPEPTCHSIKIEEVWYERCERSGTFLYLIRHPFTLESSYGAEIVRCGPVETYNVRVLCSQAQKRQVPDSNPPEFPRCGQVLRDRKKGIQYKGCFAPGDTLLYVLRLPLTTTGNDGIDMYYCDRPLGLPGTGKLCAEVKEKSKT